MHYDVDLRLTKGHDHLKPNSGLCITKTLAVAQNPFACRDHQVKSSSFYLGEQRPCVV